MGRVRDFLTAKQRRLNTLLKATRQRYGTQVKIAQIDGINPSSVSRMKARMAKRIAEHLGAS